MGDILIMVIYFLKLGLSIVGDDFSYLLRPFFKREKHEIVETDFPDMKTNHGTV